MKSEVPFEIESIDGMELLKISFFTVRINSNPNTEFGYLYKRMSKIERDRIELGEISKFLKRIGNEDGALSKYFKKEGAADRVKKFFFDNDVNYKDDYGLRLYCMRVSENIVILFNGCRKTAQKAQDCNNCSGYFESANKIAKAIDAAFYFKYLEIEDTFFISVDPAFSLKIEL